MVKTSKLSFSYLTLTFSVICLSLRVLDEFHFYLKWCPSKWTRGTQPLSCPALFNLESGREELQGKASRKSEIEYTIYTKLFFNQSHPNGQTIHLWKAKAYSNETFGQKQKITHMWRRWGASQNFVLEFIDELEKQTFIKKSVEVGQ